MIVISHVVLAMFYAAEAVILGFQHFIVMLGTTVIIPSALVPQMGGGYVSLETYALLLLITLTYLKSEFTKHLKF